MSVELLLSYILNMHTQYVSIHNVLNMCIKRVVYSNDCIYTNDDVIGYIPLGFVFVDTNCCWVAFLACEIKQLQFP